MGTSTTYHPPEGGECETSVEHGLPLWAEPAVGYCSRRPRRSPMWGSRFVGASAVGPWVGERKQLGKTPCGATPVLSRPTYPTSGSTDCSSLHISFFSATSGLFVSACGMQTSGGGDVNCMCLQIMPDPVRWRDGSFLPRACVAVSSCIPNFLLTTRSRVVSYFLGWCCAGRMLRRKIAVSSALMKLRGFGWKHSSPRARRTSLFRLLPDFSSLIVSALTPTSMMGSTGAECCSDILVWTNAYRSKLRDRGSDVTHKNEAGGQDMHQAHNVN